MTGRVTVRRGQTPGVTRVRVRLTGGGAGGSSSLAGLTDVDIPSTPDDGQALVFSTSQGAWTPGQPVGGVGLVQWSGEGPPPDFIPGAEPGDFYLDLVSGDIYELQ